MSLGPHPGGDRDRDANLDFAVFTWFFALATLFQLARGDMGLFAALRDTPNGTTLGDGLHPQAWFLCALLALVWPHRVPSLILLAAAGLSDFWWRLPGTTPSIYFHGLVSAQVLLTWIYLVVRGRSLRVDPARYVETFRTSALALLAALFFFAVFHKLTTGVAGASTAFFRLLSRYYLPFLPTGGALGKLFGLTTIAGEGLMLVLILFRRTRPVALVMFAGFSCLVGSVVYGFGAIVLAVLMPLVDSRWCRAPLARLRRMASPRRWRLGFAAAIAAAFLVDHVTGFTLADRVGLFPRGEGPGTLDVLTPMQLVWFAISTSTFAGVLLAVWRDRGAAAARLRFPRAAVSYALPLFLMVSEVGLYTGMKYRPNVAMFSGVVVRSCKPDHLILRDRLLNGTFHRDLLLVRDDGGRIGVPALALRAIRDHDRRIGRPSHWMDVYRSGPVTRLRNGVEEPFDIDDLDAVRASSWLERVLPRRLFLLTPLSEENLRCSLPGLFRPRPADPAGVR